MALGTLRRIIHDLDALDPDELRLVRQTVDGLISRATGERAPGETSPKLVAAANRRLEATIAHGIAARSLDNDVIDADIVRAISSAVDSAM